MRHLEKSTNTNMVGKRKTEERKKINQQANEGLQLMNYCTMHCSLSLIAQFNYSSSSAHNVQGQKLQQVLPSDQRLVDIMLIKLLMMVTMMMMRLSSLFLLITTT